MVASEWGGECEKEQVIRRDLGLFLLVGMITSALRHRGVAVLLLLLLLPPSLSHVFDVNLQHGELMLVVRTV